MERRVVLPAIQLACWKSLGVCDAICVCPVHWKVHLRVDRRLGIFSRLISAHPLIGSSIKKFSISICPAPLARSAAGQCLGRVVARSSFEFWRIS